MAPRPLQLDIVVAYDASWTADRLNSYQGAVSAVIVRVEHLIRDRYPWVHLRPRFLTFGEACSLGDIGTAGAVAILDATEFSAELALFAGRLQGRGVPYVVSCRAGSENPNNRLGFRTSDYISYSSIDQLTNQNSVLEQELLRAVPETHIHEELIYQFWFPRETSTIWVVCPKIHDPGEYAGRSSPDYTYLDNLGDTDALLEVMVFLSQYYPKATIEPFNSCDLPDGHTSSNLVVIGGPGSDEISNELCGEMLRLMNACIGYSIDCEQMIVTPRASTASVQYEAEYRTTTQSSERQPGLRKDRGCFARFANPLNETAGVVLIHGIHTAGVVGAARVFSERREALRNFDAVLRSSADAGSFESHFEVIVLNGDVMVPLVDPADVHTLGKPEPAVAITATRAQTIAVAGDNHDSVKVLFIAGDRGGTQMNQIQTPREYHAIQETLRACRHREIIALANPILGATRERLAVAYREVPAIVHFAGHGDDRALSIIEDRTLLATETSLDGKQLCDLFKTMKPPVRLCVLNACESKLLAQQLVTDGVVECAIGWPTKVSDSLAIAFSRGLYSALGDGLSIAEAVSVAKVATGVADGPELFAHGQPAEIVFVTNENKTT